MKYLIKEDRLKVIIDFYFENEFEDSVLETIDYGGEEWTGFWKPNGTILVGQPYDSGSNTWFFNGQYFDDQWKVFGINSNVFSYYMRDFLNKKYKGLIKIDNLV